MQGYDSSMQLDRGFETVPGRPQQAQIHRALGGKTPGRCPATMGHHFVVKAPPGTSLSGFCHKL
jgi:hypothetical protein